MNDTDLDDAEAARLSQLLHRAADSLVVETPDPDGIDLASSVDPRRRGRWLVAAAAAVLVVIAAAGALWLLSGDDAERIDTGPAEPTVTVEPQVLEQTGVWRLPEGLDGYRVVGAQDGGSFDSSSVDAPGVLAVDDPENPRRWLMVQAYDELGELDQPAAGTRQVALSDEVSATLVPSSGSTWFRLTPTADTVALAPVSGSSLGIDEAELTELLTEHFGTTGSLVSAADSTEAMEAMLDDAGFGDDRLVWQGNGDGGPGSSNQQMQVSLAGDDGTEVTIIINRSDSPAWAVAVRVRQSSELISLSSAGTPQGILSVRPRPELGRNVQENIAAVPGQPSASSLVVITDDGAWMSAFSASPIVAPSGSDAIPSSLPIDEQLRIINSLRAMSEDEFRARLTELGAEFVGAESVGVTTTVVSEPGG